MNIKSPIDPYEVLGIPKEATLDDAKRAYRRLAQKYHPDKNPHPEAQTQFQKISQAYQLLEQRLGGHDKNRHAQYQNSAFDDIFGSVFDHVSRRTQTTARLRVSIPFSLAVRGGDIQIKAYVPRSCQYCRGSGKDLKKSHRCHDCKGNGIKTSAILGLQFQQSCPTCNGLGWNSVGNCPECQGAGQTKQQRQWTLRLPPFATPTEVLLERNNEGMTVAVVEVAAHPFYRIERGQLIGALQVPWVTACLGGEVEVSDLDGNALSVQVPKGTQPYEQWQGESVLAYTSRGQPVVPHWEAHVVVPRDLTKHQEDLLAQWNAPPNQSGTAWKWFK